PLSSGSSRSDFSQRIRMGKRLHSLSVDKRAMPQLEVDERPDAITALGGSGGVRAQQRVDRVRLEDAALAGAAGQGDGAHGGVPRAARPRGEWTGEPHL